jgi:hypothetical protein
MKYKKHNSFQKNKQNEDQRFDVQEIQFPTILTERTWKVEGRRRKVEGKRQKKREKQERNRTQSKEIITQQHRQENSQSVTFF